MNTKTNSTENLLDFSQKYGKHFDKSGLSFRLLTKRVTGKRLSFKDCYLMVNAAIRQVSRMKIYSVILLVQEKMLLKKIYGNYPNDIRHKHILNNLIFSLVIIAILLWKSKKKNLGKYSRKHIFLKF